MAQIHPVYSGLLSEAERALIAGFLLHERGQILRGLEAARSDPAKMPAWWSVPTGEWFKAGESWTRLFLWTLGYKVQKDKQYPEFEDADPETARIIRDVESRGWVGSP